MDDSIKNASTVYMTVTSDEYEHKKFINASEYLAAIDDMDQYLRNLYKYREPPTQPKTPEDMYELMLRNIREEFARILIDRGLAD